MKRALTKRVASCDKDNSTRECRILEALEASTKDSKRSR